MVALRRALILLAAALLVWRITSHGMSSHYVEKLKGGDENAAHKALAWNDRQPEALYRQAISSRQEDPEVAVSLLVQSSAENPSDPRPAIAMAELAQTQGNQVRAEALVKTAVNLVPADAWVQRRTAAYWGSRGDLQQALRHWSIALETDRDSRRHLFPLMLRLAEDNRTRLAFKSIADSPPGWWEAFFKESARKATDVSSVQALFALRRESSRIAITQEERQVYVARLKKDGHAAEAYVEWVNGLDRKKRSHLGLIYDGGFELEPDNWGFDWQINSTRNALVYRADTYGVDGETALHLLFENHKGRFAGVSQTLFLDPGPYRILGKVRTDSLETQGGIKWLVRCLFPDKQDLGESERFLGSNQWRDFTFELEVPDTCKLQEIRLVSAGRRTFEHAITGDAWFDRLAINKISKTRRPPNTALKTVEDDIETDVDTPAPAKPEAAP